jgi:hypothetical protein
MIVAIVRTAVGSALLAAAYCLSAEYYSGRDGVTLSLFTAFSTAFELGWRFFTRDRRVHVEPCYVSRPGRAVAFVAVIAALAASSFFLVSNGVATQRACGFAP